MEMTTEGSQLMTLTRNILRPEGQDLARQTVWKGGESVCPSFGGKGTITE